MRKVETLSSPRSIRLSEKSAYSGTFPAFRRPADSQQPNRPDKMEKPDYPRYGMPSRLFSLIALLCLSSTLLAQSAAPARWQIYGGYAFLSNSFNGVAGSRQPLNGWDAALAFPAWHNLRFKIDLSAYRGTNLGAPQNAFFILSGGQYNWRIKRETVFVEGLIGDGGLNKDWGAKKTPGETASFSTLIGGGLDTPLTRHIAYRVGGDFQYAYFSLAGAQNAPYRIPGLPTYFGRISSGLVWKF